MKVLVTGASGFVGAHSAAALQAAGHELRLLVRDRAKAERVTTAVGIRGAELILGDVTDAGSVRSALAGCDGVLHAAGAVSLERHRADEAMVVNRTGARNVLRAAAELELDRIVHVSSTSALDDPQRRPIGPTTPVAVGEGYAASKAAAEEVARALRDEGAPVHITYPAGVIGPAAGEALGETSTAIARFVAGGILPSSHASLSLVDVRDVAEVHRQLFASSGVPDRVVCGGEHLTMAEFGRHLRALTGRRFPILPTPAWMLRSVGRWADRVASVTRLDLPMTEESMTLITTWSGTHDNAWAALGVERHDVRDTLRAAIDAWMEAGLLTPRQAGGERSDSSESLSFPSDQTLE